MMRGATSSRSVKQRASIRASCFCSVKEGFLILNFLRRVVRRILSCFLYCSCSSTIAFVQIANARKAAVRDVVARRRLEYLDGGDGSGIEVDSGGDRDGRLPER